MEALEQPPVGQWQQQGVGIELGVHLGYGWWIGLPAWWFGEHMGKSLVWVLGLFARVHPLFLLNIMIRSSPACSREKIWGNLHPRLLSHHSFCTQVVHVSLFSGVYIYKRFLWFISWSLMSYDFLFGFKMTISFILAIRFCMCYFVSVNIKISVRF